MVKLSDIEERILREPIAEFETIDLQNTWAGFYHEVVRVTLGEFTHKLRVVIYAKPHHTPMADVVVFSNGKWEQLHWIDEHDMKSPYPGSDHPFECDRHRLLKVACDILATGYKMPWDVVEDAAPIPAARAEVEDTDREERHKRLGIPPDAKCGTCGNHYIKKNDHRPSCSVAPGRAVPADDPACDDWCDRPESEE